jgi:serine protease AprX
MLQRRISGHSNTLFALALAAGSSLALSGALVDFAAAGEKGLPAVAVIAKGKTAALSFNGQVFHQAGGRILNQQTIVFAGSPIVMITWQEPGPKGMVSHFAISREGNRIDQVATTENIVRLRSQSFDPLVQTPMVPDVLRAGPENELFLVQFTGTPLDEMRAEIRAMGGAVERFLTDNTHVIRMGPDTREWVSQLPYVRWVGEFHPAFKLGDEILEQVVLGGLERGGDLPERFSIGCMRRGMEQQQAIADLVNAMGGHVDTFTPDQFRMEVTVTLAQIIAIAHRNEVNSIFVWGGPGGTDMDLMRQVGGAVPILSNAGFLGQGVRGEIFDTGIINNHQQWNGQVPLINGSTFQDAHGVACYGVNFATGTGNAQATGMMPQREQGIFSYYNNTSQFAGGPTRLSLNTAATNPTGQFRSVFQTSSVGSNRVTTYTNISEEVDDYLWKVDYLSCQSQSNASGTRDSRPQAWAKNIVAVGGITHNESLNYAQHVWATGASIGPARDLRIKPELAHSFGQVFTTYATTTTGYGQFSGTSSATPITCGHFGLLHQMWHEGVWDGFGGGSSVFHSRPRSTTARAIMINTAHRYPVTQGNMRRARIGWGAAHLGNAYNLREKTFIVNETELLQNAQSVSYPINVEPGEPEFKATMVYIDPKGNPTAAQQRINDLTLKVTSPSNVVYWGNNGLVPTHWDPAQPGHSAGANFSTPGGDPNTYDTVENVFVQNPEAGTWTVEVIASQVVQDAVLSTPATDASFALVVTGGTQGPPPAVRITFPSGMPFLVGPGQGHQVSVNIVAGSQTIMPGSPRVHFRTTTSGAFDALPMVHISGDEYAVTLPGFACGDTPQLYFSAQGHLGEEVRLPRNAPDLLYSTNIGSIVTEPVFGATFPTAWPAGWTADGLWHVNSGCLPGGTPCTPGPYAYYGRAATCNYNLPTGTNSGSLSAPQISLPTVPPQGTVLLKFCYALDTENQGTTTNFDKAEIFVNGQTKPEWRIPDSAWAERQIDLTEFAGQNVNIAFRFNTVNQLNNAFRGWHLGNVRVEATAVACEASCYANCDASTTTPILNVEDFTCFINRFAEAQALPHEQQLTHYANCDQSTTAPVLNVEDFTCFINKFAQGCP